MAGRFCLAVGWMSFIPLDMGNTAQRGKGNERVLRAVQAEQGVRRGAVGGVHHRAFLWVGVVERRCIMSRRCSCYDDLAPMLPCVLLDDRDCEECSYYVEYCEDEGDNSKCSCGGSGCEYCR